VLGRVQLLHALVRRPGQRCEGLPARQRLSHDRRLLRLERRLLRRLAGRHQPVGLRCLLRHHAERPAGQEQDQRLHLLERPELQPTGQHLRCLGRGERLAELLRRKEGGLQGRLEWHLPLLRRLPEQYLHRHLPDRLRRHQPELLHRAGPGLPVQRPVLQPGAVRARRAGRSALRGRLLAARHRLLERRYLLCRNDLREHPRAGWEVLRARDTTA
jgi:hypothetical protein